MKLKTNKINTTPNQDPEQIARDQIDRMLEEAEWVIQSKKKINLHINNGVAIRE